MHSYVELNLWPALVFETFCVRGWVRWCIDYGRLWMSMWTEVQGMWKRVGGGLGRIFMVNCQRAF